MRHFSELEISAAFITGIDSISSSRQKGKSLLTGKVLSAVQAKNEFNLSGSCRKGCWLGFNTAVDNAPHFIRFIRG